MRHRLLGVSLTLLALVWLWLVAAFIPEVPAQGEPGPRAFPFVLGVILAVLGIALAFQPNPEGPGLHASGDGGQVLSDPQAHPPPRPAAIALATVALLIAYAFLLDRAGFIISTIAVMAVAMAGILGMRRWLWIGSLAVLFTVACWVVFVPVLGVPLPGGSWMP